MRILLASLLVVITATAHAAEPVPDVSTLVRRLRHKDATQRLHTAATLGDLGVKARAARPTLVKALDDPHRLVRFYAAEAIGKIGGRLTPELKARLMKAVKTDESWIVARQAALALERLDPKGLWAHAILMQRPGESSAPFVVEPERPPLPVNVMSISHALRFLKHRDANTVLSALYYLKWRNAAVRLDVGPDVLPLMFHPATRIRMVARQFISQLEFDGARAARLAVLSTEAKNQEKIVELLRRPRKAGSLTLRTIIYIRKHSKQFPSNIQTIALLAIARQSIIRRLPDDPKEPHAVPIPATRDFGRMLIVAADAESREYWMQRLRSKDSDQVVSTLRVLANPRFYSPSLSQQISSHLGHSNQRVRDAAIRALIRSQPDWHTISTPVKKLLISKDASKRRLAIRLLFSIRSIRGGALPVLRKAIRSEPMAELREQIVRGIQQYDAIDAATTETLVKVVAVDRNAEIRALAAMCIRRFGRNAKGAVKPLFAALQAETNTTVKLQIALALEQCLKPQSPARDVVRKLVVEYSRQVAMATLREIIRKQDELAKETRRRNVLSVLGPPSRP